jgi:hypothetical protein
MRLCDRIMMIIISVREGQSQNILKLIIIHDIEVHDF